MITIGWNKYLPVKRQNLKFKQFLKKFSPFCTIFKQFVPVFSYFLKKMLTFFGLRANFSLKVCLAVCLIFQWFSAWCAYKLRAYKKKMCISQWRPFSLGSNFETGSSIGTFDSISWPHLVSYSSWVENWGRFDLVRFNTANIIRLLCKYNKSNLDNDASKRWNCIILNYFSFDIRVKES